MGFARINTRSGNIVQLIMFVGAVGATLLSVGLSGHFSDPQFSD